MGGEHLSVWHVIFHRCAAVHGSAGHWICLPAAGPGLSSHALDVHVPMTLGAFLWIYDDDDDCFYIALFSALEQTHCTRRHRHQHISHLTVLHKCSWVSRVGIANFESASSYQTRIKRPGVGCLDPFLGLVGGRQHCTSSLFLNNHHRNQIWKVVVKTVWFWLQASFAAVCVHIQIYMQAVYTYRYTCRLHRYW